MKTGDLIVSIAENAKATVVENLKEQVEQNPVVEAVEVARPGDVRPARFDKRASFLTMDALERQVVAAVRAEEFEVAAEVAEALFLLQAELPEWTDDYHSVSTEFEVEEEQIGDAMEEVYEWTVENDHKAREWFEDTGEEV